MVSKNARRNLSAIPGAISALLLGLCLAACHKEEQAVVGVAQHAVNAEHQAQATATKRDQQRGLFTRQARRVETQWSVVDESIRERSDPRSAR